jgi:PAS domain S-box-containing protein
LHLKKKHGTGPNELRSQGRKVPLLGNPVLIESLSPVELLTRLAAIVDSSEDAIIGRDRRGQIDTWNAAACRLFGYTAEEILGQSALLLVPPELHDEERGRWELVRGGERIEHFETQWLCKGGRRLTVSVSVSPIRDKQGAIIGSAATARDFCALQRDQGARARLAAIVESSDDAIIAKDLNGVVTDWNGAAERLFGYKADEIIARSILTIIPPELQHEEPVLLGKIRAGQRIEHYETQRLHKSGKRIDISLTLSPIRDSAGRVIGASKIARDITERRRSENARLMLAAIVESSDDAIISKSLDGIIMTWNAAAERLFGYKPEEIIGQPVLRLIPPDLHYEEPQIIAKLRQGHRIEHFETRRVTKYGEIIDISLTVSPMKDEHGRVTGASKIVRDIRERKATEATLIEKERLAAAGRLAATLAHEVNNPLESITNLAFILSTNPSLDNESRHYAQTLLSEVLRAGEITRKTLGFYRECRSESDVSVRTLLEDVLRAKAKKVNSKSITVKANFDTEMTVRGYAGELRQVFDNLIDNAIDALHPCGTLRIRTRSAGANALAVSVCDNGSGIDDRHLNQIFQPFFTTKLRGGSGIGLWVSKNLIEKHGGTIRVRSSRQLRRHGTVFTIILPAATVQRNC